MNISWPGMTCTFSNNDYVFTEGTDRDDNTLCWGRVVAGEEVE